jgi:hypothetical protein
MVLQPAQKIIKMPTQTTYGYDCNRNACLCMNLWVVWVENCESLTFNNFYRHKVQGLEWVVRAESTNVKKLRVPLVFAQWNLMTSPGLS